MRALVSAEMKPLLGPADMTGLEIDWIEPSASLEGGDYDALVPLLVRKVTAADLARFPRVKIVANCAVGYENIDVAECRRRGIAVTNTPDVLTEATADLTWALILSITRDLSGTEKLLRGGTWKGWNPAEFLGFELHGATLGIVGAGRIGRAVARRAVGFGMKILYSSRQARPDLEKSTGAKRASIDDVLRQSDVVSLHLASTNDTRNLMDASKFALMKTGSYFVNTTRGDLVDEDALMAALKMGHLAAAGLDVFRNEPKLDPRLFTTPRLTMLPHIGSATTKTRRAMASLALRNVREVLAGKPPVTPVPG